MPNILIADVEHEPFRIRYRLVGTSVVEATGFDFTGRYLDELLSIDSDEPWMNDYQLAYSGRRPVFGSSTIPTTSGGRYTYEFSIFPLRKGGTAIEQFVGLEDYFDFQQIAAVLDPWKLRPADEMSLATG